MKGNGIFVSQRNQGSYEDSGCGVACMIMLLKHIKFKPLPTWNELCAALCLEKSHPSQECQNDNSEIELYPEDLFRYVVRENLHFRIRFFDDEWQKSLVIAPIMVLLNGVLDKFPENAHWVVLTKLSDGYFSYLDPWEKTNDSAEKHISFEQFKNIYTGLACQLLGG